MTFACMGIDRRRRRLPNVENCGAEDSRQAWMYTDWESRMEIPV
jgi:hypothetical protein